MSGRKFRTTLIQDNNQWLVLRKLCEPLESLVDLSAEFHGYEGDRYILTIVTTAERPPQVMGFKLLDDDEMQLAAVEMERERHDEVEAAPVAPDVDEV